MEKPKLQISVGILSFKAPRTIDATLTQYGDFLNHFAEAWVFFQEFSDADRAIAQKHGIGYVGRFNNIGIQGGIRWVVENLKSEYVLFLENYFQLSCGMGEALEAIGQALALLQSRDIDIMRLRSRFRPGEPFNDVEKYTRIHKPKSIHPDFKDFHKIQKTSRFAKYIHPYKARKLSARALYIEEFPEQVSPFVRKGENKSEGIYIVDSEGLPWTNNPVLTTRALFLKLLDYADAHPSSRTVGSMQDFEKPLNCRWWRKKHFKIGVGEGIFTHNRLDR